MPLPTSLALRKEVADLPEMLADVTDEATARQIVEDLNRADHRLASPPGGRTADRDQDGGRGDRPGGLEEKPDALTRNALRLEALDRLARGEPLWRAHECVFAVLACKSEPVDPRL